MDSSEVMKLEIDVLLAEYTTLKAEVVANLTSARQVTGLTMTAIGALLAAGPIIVSSNATIVLLIAPLFFYLLACTQLRYVWLVLDMGHYLGHVLIVRLRTLHDELERRSQPDAEGTLASAVLGWESAGRGLSDCFGWLFIPVAGANLAVPLLAAISSAAAYFVLPGTELGILQIGLFALDVAGCIYCGYWGWKADKARSETSPPDALPGPAGSWMPQPPARQR